MDARRGLTLIWLGIIIGTLTEKCPERGQLKRRCGRADLYSNGPETFWRRRVEAVRLQRSSGLLGREITTEVIPSAVKISLPMLGRSTRRSPQSALRDIGGDQHAYQHSRSGR